VEEFDAVNNPEDPESGTRKMPFSREIYIEQDDFREDPPKKYFRLAPGREVRLKHAYIIKCEDVVKDESTGEILELHCTYDPETKSGSAKADRKMKGTLHWVSAAHAMEAEVRLYDRLFLKEDPEDDSEGDFSKNLNPESLTVLKPCYVEPSLADAPPGSRYQFMRLGYFCTDTVDSTPGHLVFNRTVTLRDTWAKIEKAHQKK
jgi:glutaminyl-tRNA synthetase